MSVEYLVTDTDLISVANAIRAKGGTSERLSFPSGFNAAISAIETMVPLQIVVSTKAGASCTATKGATTVSGTADASGNCTLTVTETGTWTVLAASDGMTKQQDVIVGSTAVTLSFVSRTLNDNDWETIRDVSDDGEGANYWSIGDRKAVTLNGTVGELTLSSFTTYAFIIGFNHNAALEGDNRIHFQLAKTALSGGTDVCFCDSRYAPDIGYDTSGTGYFVMNASNTSSGGWKASFMRTGICGTDLTSYDGTIIAVIPSALRAVLKSVTKYTVNSSSALTATTDYFFLLSEYEVFGTRTYANPNEAGKQAQYAYYSAGNSKVKYKNDATTTAARWWLRSPTYNASNHFVYVGANGSGEYNIAVSSSLGFAPGFCV